MEGCERSHALQVCTIARWAARQTNGSERWCDHLESAENAEEHQLMGII